MRHTVYKLFIATQYEQEEKWLNEMSAKGLALIHAGVCKYIFEDEEPGKYTYKIELLDHLPSAASSQSYLLFLEDAGVETIASIFRWVYLRKKAADGPFTLYSDVDSAIRYFRRLQIFFIMLAVLEYVVGIQNVLIGAFNVSEVRVINIVMGLLLLFLGVLLTAAAVTHTRKLKELRRERQIRE
jgi:hypothetical protein